MERLLDGGHTASVRRSVGSWEDEKTGQEGADGWALPPPRHLVTPVWFGFRSTKRLRLLRALTRSSGEGEDSWEEC